MIIVREVVIVDPINNFLGGQRFAISKDIQNVKVQSDVLVGKAFGFECFVKRVTGDATAVNGQKHILAGGILMEGHIIAEPAFDSAALIIIAAGTLGGVLVAAFEAVDIELAHIITNSIKILD